LNFGISIIGRNEMYLSISVDVVQSKWKASYKNWPPGRMHPPKMRVK